MTNKEPPTFTLINALDGDRNDARLLLEDFVESCKDDQRESVQFVVDALKRVLILDSPGNDKRLGEDIQNAFRLTGKRKTKDEIAVQKTIDTYCVFAPLDSDGQRIPISRGERANDIINALTKAGLYKDQDSERPIRAQIKRTEERFGIDTKQILGDKDKDS